ncbi:MAG: hypothetical protein WBE34_10985 [Candidatus Nitrosopolaris sp.]
MASTIVIPYDIDIIGGSGYWSAALLPPFSLIAADCILIRKSKRISVKEQENQGRQPFSSSERSI